MGGDPPGSSQAPEDSVQLRRVLPLEDSSAIAMCEDFVLDCTWLNAC